MSRNDRRTQVLEEQLRKVKEKLKPAHEHNITVRRRIIDKVDGRLCYISEYDRERKVYIR